MPTIKYNFVALDTLESLNKDAICGEFLFSLFSLSILNDKHIDVIAIVKEASPLGEITSSKLNRQVLSTNLSSIRFIDNVPFSWSNVILLWLTKRVSLFA